MHPAKERRDSSPPRATDSGREQRGGTERARDQGIVRDSRGQEQPKDKARAQQTSGEEQQRDAAPEQAPSPGQPAGGE